MVGGATREELLAPLSAEVEYPRGFYLRVVDGVTWLRGFRCDDQYVWPVDAVFALRHIRRPLGAEETARGAGWEA